MSDEHEPMKIDIIILAVLSFTVNFFLLLNELVRESRFYNNYSFVYLSKDSLNLN